MSWIQYYNQFLIIISDYWKEFNLWEGVLFIWIFGVLFSNIVLPLIQYIFFRLSRSKQQKMVLSHCNINLKPACLFLDHAAGAYILSESSIIVEKDKQFYLSKDVIQKIPTSNIDKYLDFSYNTCECYGVSFFAHNRLQSIEADEAHWFMIKLYRTDYITQAILREGIRQSQKKNIKMNQAVDINGIYPFVTSVHFVLNVYYQHFGAYYILMSEKNCFYFDVEVSPNVYDGENNFLLDIVSFFEEMIKREGLIQLADVNLTDIGFDSNNMQLIVMGHVHVDYSKTLRNKKHIRISNLSKIKSFIDDKNDYKSFFAYSCINVRTYIINSNKTALC